MRARVLVGALAGVLIALFVVARAGSPSSKASDAATEHGRPRGEARAGASPSRRDAAGRTRSEPSVATRPVTWSFGHPNPVIERLRVDRPEVCAGEENFVHAEVHTIDGRDADLRISLAGAGFTGSDSTGRDLPFRLQRPYTPEEMPRVVVFGWGGTHAEAQVPFVRVKDCLADPALAIVARRLPDEGADVFAFETRAPAGTTVSDLHWSFGDGTDVRTHELSVAHGYGDRARRTQYADFLVTVTARDDRGRVLRGSRTIELVNRDYRPRREGG